MTLSRIENIQIHKIFLIQVFIYTILKISNSFDYKIKLLIKNIIIVYINFVNELF